MSTSKESRQVGICRCWIAIRGHVTVHSRVNTADKGNATEGDWCSVQVAQYLTVHPELPGQSRGTVKNHLRPPLIQLQVTPAAERARSSRLLLTPDICWLCIIDVHFASELCGELLDMLPIVV